MKKFFILPNILILVRKVLMAVSTYAIMVLFGLSVLYESGQALSRGRRTVKYTSGLVFNGARASSY